MGVPVERGSEQARGKGVRGEWRKRDLERRREGACIQGKGWEGAQRSIQSALGANSKHMTLTQKVSYIRTVCGGLQC